MRPRRLKNEINVVPYIDVMLVLLVIFMVTAPMMTTATIDVPSVGKAAQTPAEALRVNIHADGKLSLAFSPESPRAATRESRRSGSKRLSMPAQKNPEQAGAHRRRQERQLSKAVLDVMDELQKRQQVKRIGLLVQPSGK